MSMKNNSRKNRPSVGRPSRVRSIPAEGIYSNYLFLHAAASHVGNVVCVQTQSGDTYEGIFRTFSPQFEIVLEQAHRILPDFIQNPEEDQKIVDTLVETLIFKPQDIVTICAKNVDLDYATRDTFQTDTAISRCNGNIRGGAGGEERELEPWDPSGGLTNGGDLCDLELDTNANGWNVNEMFQKNEAIYGVQSTFDQSLTGYTVQIEKKNTKEYKDQEAEAEKIANEIENTTGYKERADLENNDEDEEGRFSAVVRAESPPAAQQPPHHQERHHQNHSYHKSEPQNWRVPQEPREQRERPQHQQDLRDRDRDRDHGDRRQGSPPHHQATNYSQPPPGTNMPNPNQMNSIHSQAGSNSMNAPTPKYVPPSKRKPGITTGKLVRSTPPPTNSSGPPTPQSPQAPPQQQSKQNSYPPLMSGGPPPQGPQYITQHSQMYSQQVHNQPQAGKMNGDAGNGSQGGNQGGQQGSQKVPPRTYQRYTPNPNPNVSNPPPNMPPKMPPQHVQHKPAMHVLHVPPPSMGDGLVHHVVIPQQIVGPPPPGPPPQAQQTHVPPPQPQRPQRSRDDVTQDFRKFHHNFKLQDQQEQEKRGNQQDANVAPPQQQIQAPPPQQVPQQAPPPGVVNSNSGSANSSGSNAGQQQNAGSGESVSSDKSAVPGGAAKKFVLNPAAKPFTPRSPSTPNPSRVSSSPHTPQTPSPAVQTPVPYVPAQTPGPQIAMGPGQPQMIAMPTYVNVVPQGPMPGQFQNPHHQQRPNKRIQQVQVQSPAPIQVAAATGPPLLASTPGVQFMYQQLPPPPHFQSAPYGTPMMRVTYDASTQQQISYLTTTPPSTTPSPGQPHQAYHPGAPQPSPAGGGQQYATAPQQTPQHMPVMYPLIATGAPQLVPQFYQAAGVQPGHHNAQPIQVIMHQQHPGAPQ